LLANTTPVVFTLNSEVAPPVPASKFIIRDAAAEEVFVTAALMSGPAMEALFQVAAMLMAGMLVAPVFAPSETLKQEAGNTVDAAPHVMPSAVSVEFAAVVTPNRTSLVPVAAEVSSNRNAVWEFVVCAQPNTWGKFPFVSGVFAAVALVIADNAAPVPDTKFSGMHVADDPTQVAGVPA
jgi:hypothetical protein